MTKARERKVEKTEKEKGKRAKMIRPNRKENLVHGSQEKARKEIARASSLGTMSPKGKEKHKAMRRDATSAVQLGICQRLQGACRC